MILDKGLGLSQTGDLLELAADYIDYVKLTFGTAALYPQALLQAKVALIRSYGIEVYPGGTFFEIALVQDRLEQYLQRCEHMGFTHVEVSDGTITLDPTERRRAIALAIQSGLKVVTEVGKKDATAPFDPTVALDQIYADLEAGATKVIIEGRESGTVGLFNSAGQIKRDAMEQIASGLADPSVLMWEAPQKAQQVELIRRFGPNVSLGNIPPSEALALEALRRGLRGDTFELAPSTLSSTGG